MVLPAVAIAPIVISGGVASVAAIGTAGAAGVPRFLNTFHTDPQRLTNVDDNELDQIFKLKEREMKGIDVSIPYNLEDMEYKVQLRWYQKQPSSTFSPTAAVRPPNLLWQYG
jgi:hypothetical protein